MAQNLYSLYYYGMAFDFEHKDITATNHEFAPHELLQPAWQMPERAVFYVYSDAIITDLDGRLWIEAEVSALDEGLVKEAALDEEEELSRVIKLHNGYAVDDSHFGITTKEALNERFQRKAIVYDEDLSCSEVALEPVIAWAGNAVEYKLLCSFLGQSFNLVPEDSILLLITADDSGEDEDRASL